MTDTPAQALGRAVEQVLTHDAFMHSDDDEIAQAVIEALQGEGWRIVGPEDQPDWADPLLDALFTGKRLDFDGKRVPEWLQRRLEQEFGFPYPIAQKQPHPDEPAEPLVPGVDRSSGPEAR